MADICCVDWQYGNFLIWSCLVYLMCASGIALGYCVFVPVYFGVSCGGCVSFLGLLFRIAEFCVCVQVLLRFSEFLDLCV